MIRPEPGSVVDVELDSLLMEVSVGESIEGKRDQAFLGEPVSQGGALARIKQALGGTGGEPESDAHGGIG